MCAPTRDEMFTGLSRAGRGRPGAGTPFFTNELEKLGYTNGMAGKWFVGSVFDPPLRGFHESCIMVNGYRHWGPDVMVFGSGGLMNELNQPKITGRLNEWEIPREGDGPHLATRLHGRHADDVSMDFLCDFIRRKRGSGPFFAYYSSKLTHVPQSPTPDGDKDAISVFEAAFNKIEDRNKLSGLQEVAAAEAKRRGLHVDTQNFRNDGIAYLDKMAGRLIDELERSNLRDSTLVLFTSDNGNSQFDPLPDGVEPCPARRATRVKAARGCP
jgi:arylsulfatase A